MEREVAFKLLAAHGMVDAPFFEYLRRNPVRAAATLHIKLTKDDIAYLKKLRSTGRRWPVRPATFAKP